MPKHRYAIVDDTFNSFKSHHIRVKVAQTKWEKQQYFKLRQDTFAREQKILPENETDAEDVKAVPIIALATSWNIGDVVVGAVRIYTTSNNIWYGGRLCVTRAYRGHGNIGKALINEAVSRAKDQGCQTFLANVQPQNETYFQSVHWQTLHNIDICGRPHVHMQADLNAYPFMPRDYESTLLCAH